MILIFAALLAACGNSIDLPPDIILITLDTTRADALGVYGHVDHATPVIDSLAQKGVLFEEAQTVAPFTLPAHSSILTGLYPDRHQVRDNDGFVLNSGVATLATILRDAGWQTSAFVSAAVLDERYGLDSGFDVYDDGFHLAASDTKPGLRRRTAGDTVERASAWWWSANAERPVFQWVHFYDAHHPLNPDEPWSGQYNDPYIAAIAEMDHAIGELLATLEHERPDRPTWVVVVGDHGEGRSDHGELTHGWFVYRSTMRVPFLISGPNVKTRRVAELTSVVDITPTILELVEVDIPADLDGISLASVLEGEEPPQRVVFGETWGPRRGFGYSQLRMAQNHELRFVEAPHPELYRWQIDPGEDHNLYDRESSTHNTLSEMLSERVATFDQNPPTPTSSELAPELAALGYVVGPWASSQEALPDPKEAPDLPQRTEFTIAGARQRPPEDGVKILEEFLTSWPGAVMARHHLVEALVLTGDVAGARRALQPLLDENPDSPTLLARQAELLMAGGLFKEARESVEHARRIRPTWSSLHALEAEIERRRGNCDLAKQLVDEALRRDPDAWTLKLVRGTCLLDQGQVDEALVDLFAVERNEPDNRDVPMLLGTALARNGRFDEAVRRFQTQLKRAPRSQVALAGLGMALASLNRCGEAIPHLNATVDNTSLGEEPILFLAKCSHQVYGATDRTLELLDEAASRNPNNGQVEQMRRWMHPPHPAKP